jgi:hypothetical protein
VRASSARCSASGGVALPLLDWLTSFKFSLMCQSKILVTSRSCLKLNYELHGRDRDRDRNRDRDCVRDRDRCCDHDHDHDRDLSRAEAASKSRNVVPLPPAWLDMIAQPEHSVLCTTHHVALPWCLLGQYTNQIFHSVALKVNGNQRRNMDAFQLFRQGSNLSSIAAILDVLREVLALLPTPPILSSSWP